VNCVGVTKKGLPCKGQAEKGYLTCPSHRLAVEGTLPSIHYCASTTLLGKPCRAGATAGHPSCGQHREQVIVAASSVWVAKDYDEILGDS
jgi:hypothetical protein